MTRVKINLDPIAILNNHGYPDKARLFLANEIVKVSEPYTPERERYLIRSATIIEGGRAIEYNTPYARKLWYGDDFNFKGAPVRGSRWVERAIASNGNQIVASMQRMANKGGFK
ncbi:minor capsid protein [Pseudomonas sp.]|uniref:minor capsid protein n=1 Tax=Pseudomonas sp. TaxID=306 RepID=UPI002639F939|nr:minor capsid protein [Pseudomonas sp.]